ncbi:ParA family protein [Myxococcus fulvus]|uniref:Chromosome partitioning protein n=1 Tax=Myxococcus fulvus TaxID=33 RepID=A0A511SWV2_MYXFU|nr:ParA family protein [Myxococcus fulvus]AKF83264.1 cobyrinic acid a,c-diamide synthase [Myxococcus fulvus 124B02]GEN06389.1 sporulation initiation inhibitor protein Soj [Myxococcus fulvus]SET50059.1 chromosome partitioning protein [Myxococcus fulvus]
MRRIAFINEKGGTCKTTLAVNTAAWLARERGLRVLLVDLDTQGHASKALGLDVRTLPRNVFHLLTDDTVALADVVRPTAVAGLDVLPSYKEMADFPVVVASHARRSHRLADRLEAAKDAGYDAVVFDSPPSMGLTTRNILVAATEVVVPVALTYLALDGCAEVADTVRQVGEAEGRSDLSVTKVVPTLYRKTALATAILERLRAYFPESLATTPLGYDVKVDEAQSHGKTIFEYAPRSRGAQMLAAIASEIHGGPAPRKRKRAAPKA